MPNKELSYEDSCSLLNTKFFNYPVQNLSEILIERSVVEDANLSPSFTCFHTNQDHTYLISVRFPLGTEYTYSIVADNKNNIFSITKY